jgi:hypothetical protein
MFRCGMGTRGCRYGRTRAAEWPGVLRQTAGGRSVVGVGGQGLVEYEHWDRLGLGGIEGRALIEEEVSLGWRTGGRDRGRSTALGS